MRARDLIADQGMDFGQLVDRGQEARNRQPALHIKLCRTALVVHAGVQLLDLFLNGRRKLCPAGEQLGDDRLNLGERTVRQNGRHAALRR